MLSVKPWKTDAILRLVSSIILSFLAGSFVSTALQYRITTGLAGLKFGAVVIGALVCLGAALVLIRREWRLERFAARVGLLLVCLYAGLFLGAWAQKIAGQTGPSLGQMVVALLSFQGAALIWKFCGLLPARSGLFGPPWCLFGPLRSSLRSFLFRALSRGGP